MRSLALLLSGNVLTAEAPTLVIALMTDARMRDTGEVAEQELSGGRTNAGSVVRVGDTVRRPRRPGFEVVEGLLKHFEGVEFRGAPRLLGIDDQGREVLEYIEGEAYVGLPWQTDDARNAEFLGRISGFLRELHEATFGFDPPNGCAPQRLLPVDGGVWTHGDVVYANVVFSGNAVGALIDWEFAAPADRCHDPAGLLALGIRGPRPDADDYARRADAAKRACEAIASGYGVDSAERRRLPIMAASVIDDAVEFWREGATAESELSRSTWRANWLRENVEFLART